MYVMHFRIWKVLWLVHSCAADTSYFVRNLLAVRFASNKAFFPLIWWAKLQSTIRSPLNWQFYSAISTDMDGDMYRDHVIPLHFLSLSFLYAKLRRNSCWKKEKRKIKCTNILSVFIYEFIYFKVFSMHMAYIVHTRYKPKPLRFPSLC